MGFLRDNFGRRRGKIPRSLERASDMSSVREDGEADEHIREEKPSPGDDRARDLSDHNEDQTPSRGTSEIEVPGEKGPLVVRRNQHAIIREDIDSDALKVMYRLMRYGYKAYLVGGAVRDLLLDKPPKDFDIGTDAKPEDVRALFRNSRIIGRRFKINHVFFAGNKIHEVATFRATGASEVPVEGEAPPVISDNVYGDPQSDAVRRDLTINGLFYDPGTQSVIDYVGGIADLKSRMVRIIGDPDVRIHEDPVRMIRAIRHAARADFEIHRDTYQSICRNAELIDQSVKARVYEEFMRELRGGAAWRSFQWMDETGLLKYLFPVLHQALVEDRDCTGGHLDGALQAIDQIIWSGEQVNDAVMLAGIMIGNLPKVTKKEFSVEVAGEEVEDEGRLERLPVFDLWEVSPFGECLFPLIPPTVAKPRRGKRIERARVPHLEKLIQDVFGPVGVPRKDREYMECLILARYLMFFGRDDANFVAALTEKIYFKDALSLLAMSVYDEKSRIALAYWQGRHEVTEESRGEKRKRPKRRRRRHR